MRQSRTALALAKVLRAIALRSKWVVPSGNFGLFPHRDEIDDLGLALYFAYD